RACRSATARRDRRAAASCSQHRSQLACDAHSIARRSRQSGTGQHHAFGESLNMASIQRQPLELPGADNLDAPAPKLRYTPLPALALADYVEDYMGSLWHSGVFDHLSTAGAGLNLADIQALDLSAVGVVG